MEINEKDYQKLCEKLNIATESLDYISGGGHLFVETYPNFQAAYLEDVATRALKKINEIGDNPTVDDLYDGFIDLLTEEDVITPVGKLADKFPNVTSQFMPGYGDMDQPESNEGWFIYVDAYQPEVGRIKLLVELRRVFNLSYKEAQEITFPYVYFYPEYTSEKKVRSDLNQFLSCGIKCNMDWG